MRTFVVMVFAAVFIPGNLDAADLLIPSQYPDLQSAYQAANWDDRIVVSAGTYSGPQNSLPNITKYVTIQGDGGLVVFDLGQNQVLAKTNAFLLEINDVVIQSSDPTMAAIETLSYGILTLNRVHFRNNNGVVVRVAATLRADNCQFVGNNSPVLIEDVNGTFYGSVNVIACEFVDNVSSTCFKVGPGTHAFYSSQFTRNFRAVECNQTNKCKMFDCWFYDNDSVLESDGTIEVELDKCVAALNVQVIKSTNSYNTTLTNNVFVGNGLPSGATPFDIQVQNTSPNGVVDVHHCTFAENEGSSIVAVDGAAFTGSLSTMVRNSIFWNPQSVVQISIVGSDYELHDYNLVYGGGFGTNVITADPQFKNPFALDFTLDSQSPAIDAGSFNTATSALLPYDAINNKRVDGSPDLGAYEKTQASIRFLLFGTYAEYTVYGNPGDEVHLFTSESYPGWTTTPFGDFLLHPYEYLYAGCFGTIGTDGTLKIVLPFSASATHRTDWEVQALVGSQFTTNKRNVYWN